MWNAAATCAHRRILLGTIALAAFLAIVPLTQAAGGADRRPPTAPTNLRVTAATVSTVSLAWDASRDNKGGAQFSGYGLYQDGVLVGSATSTTYTFAGLDCGTTATFGVDALDSRQPFSGRDAHLHHESVPDGYTNVAAPGCSFASACSFRHLAADRSDGAGGHRCDGHDDRRELDRVDR
jgi:hypothetical protein